MSKIYMYNTSDMSKNVKQRYKTIEYVHHTG